MNYEKMWNELKEDLIEFKENIPNEVQLRFRECAIQSFGNVIEVMEKMEQLEKENEG